MKKCNSHAGTQALTCGMPYFLVSAEEKLRYSSHSKTQTIWNLQDLLPTQPNHLSTSFTIREENENVFGSPALCRVALK